MNLRIFYLFITLIIIHNNSLNAKVTITYSSFSCSDFVFDINVYSSFFDWNSNESLGGSSAGKEILSTPPQVIVVANKNDTDSDGAIDFGDSFVNNEVDLIRVVVNNPGASGTYNASQDPIILETISGEDINVYLRPDKTNKITIPYTVPTNTNFPLQLFIESGKESSSLWDIKVKISNSNIEKPIEITSVWVELFEKYLSTSDNIPSAQLDPCTEFAINGSTNSHAVGHGFYNSATGTNTKVGGRSLFQWELLPAAAHDLITLDGSRQRDTENWVNLQASESTTPMPCKLKNTSKLRDSGDVPNDDPDAPNACLPRSANSDGFFFTTDLPSTQIDEELESFPLPRQLHYFKMDKTNFWEFVRLAPKGYNFEGESLQGSRGSTKETWNNAYSVSKDDDLTLTTDNSVKTMTALRMGDQFMNPDTDYDVSYEILDQAYTYDLGIYYAVVFSSSGSPTRDIDLFRFNVTQDGSCIDIAEEYSFSIPANQTEYNLIFDGFEIKITESANTPDDSSFFYNWGTFYSTEKTNSINEGHIQLIR